MKIKNVSLYNKKKDIYNLIFKKKIVKKFFLNKRNFFNILKILKVLFLFNFYDVKYNNIYFKNYNFLKYIWNWFIIIYYYINNKLKKKNNFFFEFKFNKIFKIVNLNLNLFLKILNWRKKFLKINLFIEPLKIKKKMNFFILKPFYNNYKNIIFVSLIKYLIKFFEFRIKKTYTFFWKRLYIYKIKRLFSKIEYIIKKYFNLLLKQYKIFFYLINFSYKNNKKNKILFFLLLLKNIIGRNFLIFFNFYKLFKYYKYVKNNLLNYKYLKKTNFYLFFFSYSYSWKNNKLLYNIYKNLKLFKVIIKIKVLIIIKNLIFLLFLQFFMNWLNYYNFLNKYIGLKKIKDNNLNIKSIKVGLNIIKKLKWNCLSIFKLNYFFYNNIVSKKVIKLVRENF